MIMQAWPKSWNVASGAFGIGSTGADGAYAIAGLEPGEYRLYVLAPAPLLSTWHGGSDYLDATVVSVADSQTLAVDVALALGATIVGTVTDADTRAPLSDVTVCTQLMETYCFYHEFKKALYMMYALQ